MDIGRLCDRIIRFGFILIVGLVPLLLTPWNFELFEYNKMIAVYALTTVIVGAWIVKSVHRRELVIPKTPLDIPIALFVISQLVSTVLSMDPHVSWFGYYSRFNGGMWSVISYVLLYYAFVAHMSAGAGKPDAAARPAKHKNASVSEPQTDGNGIPRVLVYGLVTAVLVAIYGVLERLGIDKNLWVQDVQNRVFSTLGQPNWLAAYLAGILPVSMALFLGTVPQYRNNPVRLLPYVLPIPLYFLVILFTKSRSGLLGFVIADIVFWMLLAGKGIVRPSRSHRFFLPVALLHAAFVLAVFAFGTGMPAIDRWFSLKGLTAGTPVTVREATASAQTVTGPALETGGTESGTIRSYVWRAAVNAWRSSPKTMLVGTGTETFAFAFYRHKPAGHNLTSEWDFLYNKAHNEYLNYLATTGAFGLATYLLLLAAFAWWFVRHAMGIRFNQHQHDGPLRTFVIECALFAGWLSVLVTNFFGFSVVITQIYLFLFPAAVFVLAKATGKRTAIPITKDAGLFARAPAAIRARLTGLLTAASLVLTFAVLFGIGSLWYADTLYAKGYRLGRAGLFGQAVPSVNAAIGINPGEPLYHDELSASYATLAVAAFEGGNATQAAQLANLAVNENSAALQTSPNNVNFLKTRTKVYYTLSAINPEFNAKAVEALKQALALSPNDPKIYYNLAILVGREGNDAQAIDYLKKAKRLKPNYRDAYYALWVFYTEGKQTAEARNILTDYLTNVDPNDQDFRGRLQ